MSPQREPDDWPATAAGSCEMGPMFQYVLEQRESARPDAVCGVLAGR